MHIAFVFAFVAYQSLIDRISVQMVTRGSDVVCLRRQMPMKAEKRYHNGWLLEIVCIALLVHEFARQRLEQRKALPFHVHSWTRLLAASRRPK